MQIAIIGGGASGLTAAIGAARRGASVTVIEKLPRVGKKLLATGNGRCNLSNKFFDIDKHYRSGDQKILKSVFNSFSPSQTLEFFYELGVPIREGEEGKLYPYSLQAASVLDVLRFEAARLGVEICCGTEIVNIERCGGSFLVGGRSYNKLIIATGGMAAPSLGGGRSGYAILRAFGHSITPLYPSIVQLKTCADSTRALKGIKIDASLTIRRIKEALGQKNGELLFTEYGLSGPPAMYLSSLIAGGPFTGLCADIDCLPGFSREELTRMLEKRRLNYPERALEDFFVGLIPKRLGQVLLKTAGMSLSLECGSLSREDVQLLSFLAKCFSLDITGTLGFNDAQVTAGGAVLDGFGIQLESFHTPGLYACGEVLDVDGDCGGYNLQWAWSSGMVAGRGAAGGNNA